MSLVSRFLLSCFTCRADSRHFFHFNEGARSRLWNLVEPHLQLLHLGQRLGARTRDARESVGEAVNQMVNLHGALQKESDASPGCLQNV